MKWNRQRTLWVGQLSAFTTCFLYFGKGLKPANTTLLRRCEKNHLSSLCGTLQTQPSFFEVGKLTTKSFYRKWSGILAFKIFVFICPIRHDKDVYKIKRFSDKKASFSSIIWFFEYIGEKSWSTCTKLARPKFNCRNLFFKQ